MTPRIVVVGDIAVDVLVTPSAPPVRGADVPATIRSTPGGAGANTAAWLARLGAEVTLVARVGDDPAGRDAVASLRGVRPAVAVDADAPTATVVVIVDGEGAARDRTMLSDRGAAARLTPADLPDLTGADHLHLSGYVLLDPSSRPAGLAALAAARAAGLSTSVDPQAAPALTDEFATWIEGVDLLLPNAAEWARFDGLGLDGVQVGAVAVTDGPRPARWIDARGVVAMRPPRTAVVDPTGAGDAFDAGVLDARLRGAAPVDALRAGCAAAAEAISRPGARPLTQR